jgi:hypothetical protein
MLASPRLYLGIFFQIYVPIIALATLGDITSINFMGFEIQTLAKVIKHFTGAINEFSR